MAEMDPTRSVPVMQSTRRCRFPEHLAVSGTGRSRGCGHVFPAAADLFRPDEVARGAAFRDVAAGVSSVVDEGRVARSGVDAAGE